MNERNTRIMLLGFPCLLGVAVCALHTARADSTDCEAPIKCDLRIDYIDVDPDNYLVVGIGNGWSVLGDAPADIGRMAVFVDHTQVADIYPGDIVDTTLLNAGSRRIQINTGVRLSGPERRVLVVLDADDEVVEMDEYRNEMSVSLAVPQAAGFDLAPSARLALDGNLSIDIQNVGDASSPANLPVAVDVVVEDRLTWTVLLDLPALAAGATHAHDAGIHLQPDRLEVRCRVNGGADETDHTNNSFVDRPGIDEGDVVSWYQPLWSNPALVAAMVWDDAPVLLTGYDNWPADVQDKLREFLLLLERGQPLPSMGLPQFSHSFQRNFAIHHYVSHVALSLWFENQAATTWSLLDLDAEQLALILDSRSVLMLSNGPYPWGVKYGNAVPWNPNELLSFMKHTGILDPASQDNTALSLLDWMRGHTRHVSSSDNSVDTYGFGGRVLMHYQTYPKEGFDHIMHACDGCARYIQGMMRIVNIPSFHITNDLGLPNEVHSQFEMPTVRKSPGAGLGITSAHADDIYSVTKPFGFCSIPTSDMLWSFDEAAVWMYPDPSETDCNDVLCDCEVVCNSACGLDCPGCTCTSGYICPGCDANGCNSVATEVAYHSYRTKHFAAMNYAAGLHVFRFAQQGAEALDDLLLDEGQSASPNLDCAERDAFMQIIQDKIDEFGGTSAILQLVFGGGSGVPITTSPDTNTPPRLEPIPAAMVASGQQVSVTLQAQDPDAGAQLTYAVVNPPAGSSLSGNVFTWQVGSEVGYQPIVFAVTDESNGGSQQVFYAIADFDCNSNGIGDSQETAADCDDNDVPEDCEAYFDCNANSLSDSCEIADGSAEDCNTNGIPDSCDLASGTSRDCTLNNIPDSCDIANGLEEDTDSDGIPDDCEQLVSLFVDAAAAPGGDGSNWATAFTAVRPAIDSIPAEPPGGHLVDIQVLGGTYSGTDNRNLLVQPFMTLRCKGGPCDMVPEPNGTGPIFKFHTQLAGGVVRGFAISNTWTNNGAIEILAGHPSIEQCKITAGLGTFWAGGIYVGSIASATVRSCVLTDHNAGLGAAMYVLGTAIVDNCTIKDNMATTPGGGGGIHCGPTGNVSISSSILWNNRDSLQLADDLRLQGGSASVRYTMIAGGEAGVHNAGGDLDWGPGNLVDAPIFVSGYKQDSTSPSINAGDFDLAYFAGSNDVDGERRTRMCRVDIGASESPYYLLDCNANGRADACDLALGIEQDCDADGVPDDCQLAGGGGADCNGNNILDSCDIASGVSEDDNDNGVPDECDTCVVFADCADLTDRNGTGGPDGIRDDNCVWWACIDGLCVSTDVPFADMGSTNGVCPPDLYADSNDRWHALNCFSNVHTDGTVPYPCEDNSPFAYNVDAGGAFGACAPDGVCDSNDGRHAMNAFNNSSTCSCPSSPAPQLSQPPVQMGQTTLLLEADRSQVRPGELIAVEVSLGSSLSNLNGYQLHLSAHGGSSGALELVDILLERRKYAAIGRPAYQAFNIRSAQMLAGLSSLEEAAAGGTYLATFVYRASPDASGAFRVDALFGENPQHRTFLFPNHATGAIDVRSATSAKVFVRGRLTRR